MREIKFRVWCKEGECMLDWEHLISEGDFREQMISASQEDAYYSPLMQYTGSKDKNGKEIYEGDIDRDEHNNLSVICYIKKYGAYCVVPLELYQHEDYENEVVYQYGYDCYFHNVIPNKYLNIIGNIYENPSLLEESK